MKTRQELFLEHSANFKKELEVVLKDFYGDFVSEYLPFVDEDTENNAWYRCQEMFKNLLEGRVEKLPYPLDGYCGREIRMKIFEEHKEELVKLLNADLLRKISELESSVKFYQECLDERRPRF